MRYQRVLATTSVAFAIFAICSVGTARGQPAPGKGPAELYRPFIFVEIEEVHQDGGGAPPAGPGREEQAFPYSFDARRRILRPVEATDAKDLLKGTGGAGSAQDSVQRTKAEGQLLDSASVEKVPNRNQFAERSRGQSTRSG